MIATLWNNAEWLLALLPFASFLVRFSRFAGLLSFLGPFAEAARVFLEGLARLLTFLLMCVWHCLFDYRTWAPLTLVYLFASFYPVQDIQPPKFKKRTAIVQHAAPRKASKRASDVRSITRNQFQR